MGTTTIHSLRYPEPTDPADVPTDMNELATDVDNALPPVSVSGRWLKGGASGAMSWQPIAAADLSFIGAANGVAGLDSSGKVPVAQLPAGLGGITRIQDSLLGAAAASIDFVSIPATYLHLRLVLAARSDAATTLVNATMRFNSDSTAVYSSIQVLNSAPTTASAQEQASATSLTAATIPAASAPAGSCGTAVIDIPNYAGTSFLKLINGISGYSTGASTGTTTTKNHGGIWGSLTAINRITLLLSSGNYAAGSRATLYGLA
jgi:hypothetical protein